jgi:hypothetical protein
MGVELTLDTPFIVSAYLFACVTERVSTVAGCLAMRAALSFRQTSFSLPKERSVTLTTCLFAWAIFSLRRRTRLKAITVTVLFAVG